MEVRKQFLIDLLTLVKKLKLDGKVLLAIDANQSLEPRNDIKQFCKECALYDLMAQFYNIDSHTIAPTSKGRKRIDFVFGTINIVHTLTHIRLVDEGKSTLTDHKEYLLLIRLLDVAVNQSQRMHITEDRELKTANLRQVEEFQKMVQEWYKKVTNERS